MALKIIYKQTEKYIAKDNDPSEEFSEYIRASTLAVDATSKEKVIKVFNISLQLMNLLVSSSKLEEMGEIENIKKIIIEKNIISKLLQKSEEGNTRMTNKIHETLLDLSFHPKVGEALLTSFIL